MITLDDLKRLVWNYHQKVGTKGRAQKKDQKFIDLLLNRYIDSLGMYVNESDALSKNISMSRSDIIWEVWELKGSASVDAKVHSFETTKSTINTNLEEMELGGLNPKRIRIFTAQGKKGAGEEANYFVTTNQPAKKKGKEVENVGEEIVVSICPNSIEKLYSNIKEEIEAINNHPSLRFYVPLNCAETIYSSQNGVDLEKEVDGFLEGDRKTLLLLGDSGSGKSTYCKHLVLRLFERFKNNKNFPFPFLVQLNTRQVQDATSRGKIIEDEFKNIGLSDDDIIALKRGKNFVFILDGYDELKKKENLYTNNKLGDWKAKVIFTCRTQYLEKNDDYFKLFAHIDQGTHLPNPLSYQSLYLVPFSEEKVENYLKQYAVSNDSQWNDWHEYKQKISSLYNLRELSSNPLLLYIITRTLPSLLEKVDKGKIQTTFTRSMLYEDFFDRWFGREENRLRECFEKELFFEFAEELGFEMFLAGKMEIEYRVKKSLFKKNSKKADQFENFFNSDDINIIRARSGCPIQRTRDNAYRFMHKSFQEFCVARKLAREIEDGNYANFNNKLLTDEPGILQFMPDIE